MNDHTTTGLPPAGTRPGAGTNRPADVLSADPARQRTELARAQAKWVLLLIVLVAVAGAAA